MVFSRKFYSLILLLHIFLLNTPSISQIIFKELPGYKQDLSDSSFWGISSTRNIIPLNGKWQVFSPEDKEPRKFSVNIPSSFLGEGDLVFENTFELTREQILSNKIKLHLLGLSYIADILINDIVVYRHRGGEYPFKIELPTNILNTEKRNKISIKLAYAPDSETTIPLKQKFFFPEGFGGITKDIFLYLEPTISIADYKLNYVVDKKSKNLLLTLTGKVDGKYINRIVDTISADNDFKVTVTVYSPDSTSRKEEESFRLKPNETKNIKRTIEVSDPLLWSPEFPYFYRIEISLSYNDILLDNIKKDLPVYFLTPGPDNLLLNEHPFTFKGVTYIPLFGATGNLSSYNRMEDDIRFIKQAGFNSIRFAKSSPHPYYLKLCEKYGLLALIEIPLNYIPAEISADHNFITRCMNFLSGFIQGYSEFGSFASIGLGGSYLPNLEEHRDLITKLFNTIPINKNFLTYASFSGVNLTPIENLDLYGIEITGNNLSRDTSGLGSSVEELGKHRVFVSEITYIVSEGNSSGYVNENTYEAQAKYFEDFLDAFHDEYLSGYFFNSIFDYRGEYSSILSGYDKNNLYHIGLVSENRKTDYLSFRVVKSKLQNAERITIPIGTRRDKSPMIFIVAGLIIALLVGVLVNSGRKFREDATRALLRPYNFFADIRDQRIISGYYSSLLAVIISVVIALLISSLLYYFKDKIFFEKLFLSFGSPSLMNIVSYLSWNPLQAILLLTAFFFVFMFVALLVIKFFSLFIKNRVHISSIYFTVIWSFLPVVLLIPVGIILYRVLDSDVANIYIYLLLLIFLFWIFYRLMKGIYVIFDINPGRVYMYSILLLIVIVCAFVLYYEFTNSLSDYLFLTFRQYNLSDLL